MRWSEVMFLHWDVAPRAVSSWVPDWLTLDRRRGRAFVGVVAMFARGPSPPIPWSWLAKMPAYAQINVRTYVTGPAGPGILLRKSSVGSVLAAAGARLVGQPYVPERAHLEFDDARFEVESAPLSFEGEALAGPPARAKGVERWLIERYVVYGEAPGGIPYHMRVRHRRWRVRRMKVSLCETRIGEIGHAPPGGVLLAEPVDVDFTSLGAERIPGPAEIEGPHAS